MEKVKISKELAIFITYYKGTFKGVGEWEDKLLSEHAYQWCSGNYADATLEKISPLQLSKILINGYEVELTPEEKLSKHYHTDRTYVNGGVRLNNSMNSIYRRGIRDALSILGIKVRGINVHDD